MKTPSLLDRIADVVLRYRPQPKTAAQIKRASRPKPTRRKRRKKKA